MANVLVIGGAGYIGAHACKALAQAGHTPVVYDNFSLGWRDFVKWGPTIEGDILDQRALEAALKMHKIDAAMHFAAFALVGESVSEPAKYYRNNVAGVISLLDAMRACGVETLVFSSTCATYGTPDRSPITEETPQRPINPYGASKQMAEQIIADYAKAYGMRFYAPRYFNACGADPDCEIGEMRDPETHLIPRALMSLLGQIDDFAVFGSDYPTPDGTAVRDYIHVTDLAEAHVAALDRLLAGHEGGFINLGTGEGLSVKEVLDAVERVTGRALPAASGPRRPGDPPSLVADPSRAAQELGFSPRLSDIDTIIATAWAWHQGIHWDHLVKAHNQG